MSIHWADHRVTVHAGDSLDILRELDDSSVDSVVTDPHRKENRMNPNRLAGVGFGTYQVGCACGECRNPVHSVAKHCDWTFCDECFISGHAENCPDKPKEFPCPTQA